MNSFNVPNEGKQVKGLASSRRATQDRSSPPSQAQPGPVILHARDYQTLPSRTADRKKLLQSDSGDKCSVLLSECSGTGTGTVVRGTGWSEEAEPLTLLDAFRVSVTLINV